MKNKIENYLIILALAFPIIILFIFVQIFEIIEHEKFYFTEEGSKKFYNFISKSGQIGDSLGGVTTWLITSLSLYFLLKQFQLQRVANQNFIEDGNRKAELDLIIKLIETTTNRFLNYTFTEIGCNKEVLGGINTIANNQFLKLLLYSKREAHFIQLHCFNEYISFILQFKDLINFINSANISDEDKVRLKQFMSIQIIVIVRMMGDLKKELEKIKPITEPSYQKIIPNYIMDIKFVENELSI